MQTSSIFTVTGTKPRQDKKKTGALGGVNYRVEPLLLVQELGEILRRRTQHALLLKILDPSLWFLVEPVWDSRTRNTLLYRSNQKGKATIPERVVANAKSN